MVHAKTFMFCIVILSILAFVISHRQSYVEFVYLEAENGVSNGTFRYRSEASGGATINLLLSQTVTNTFTTKSSCSVTIQNVTYTNDGSSDKISAYIDGFLVGSFDTVYATNSGRYWNVVRNTGRIGVSEVINSGSHQLLFKAVNTDRYGVELDTATLNLTCANPSQPNSTQPSPMCTNISLIGDALDCSNHSYAVTHSTNTSCAEEDNVQIPIYSSEVKSFKITATLPLYYPNLTTTNSREPNFKNCQFASRNIWKLGSDDDSDSEFSVLCSSDVYVIGEPVSTFCHEISIANNFSKYDINFTAKGTKNGLVEASIGSVLTVKLTQVTGLLVVEVRCFGRKEKWISLGNAFFSSRELTKVWRVPDLTWSEGQNVNQIQLRVVNGSSVNATGKFDYVKLDRRAENGESAPSTIFNNGTTIIEAITIDFWWLYPKGMTVKNVNNNKEWNNVSYFRIYRKIPGTNNFSQLFVLYQDGNSRVLPFPPDGIDWIPFGSSVIIGPTTSSSVRPYASIVRVNINAESLAMEMFYETGGRAVATLQYTEKSTTINVDEISYASSLIPFATFRSMWVADGNADVDRIQTNNHVWHIQHEWQSITGSFFQFFRSCVSSHNTLSPDILIAVKCQQQQSTVDHRSSGSPSSKSTVTGWALIVKALMFHFIIW